MPGGIPFGSWGDFNRVTGPAVLTGPEKIFSEAAEPAPLMSWFVAGTEPENMIQGGEDVREFPLVDDGGTAQNSLPGSVRTALQPQVLREMVVPWRLTEDVSAYNLIIRGLNEGGGDQYHRMKSLQRAEEIRLATSYSNKFERDLFAFPDATTMLGSGATAVDPQSVFAFLNEYGATPGTIYDAADTRYPAGTGLPFGVTTLQGQAPATEKWWRTWQISYTDSVAMTTENPCASNLLTAMTKAVGLVKFRRLFWREGATVNDAYRNPDYVWLCSLQGLALVQSLCVAGQSYFRMDAQDPFYPSPRFADIPFVHCTGMDSARVYPTSGTTAPANGLGTTEGSAASVANNSAGPRFILLSRKWFRQFFHSEFYLYQWPSQRPDLQWDTEIVPYSTLHNRMCISRRKMAFIYPSANITGFYG